VRSRDGHRNGQTLTVEVLQEPSLPREISIAPGAEPAHREAPIDAHAPHIVGDSTSEWFDASDVFTPLPECLPAHRRILTGFRASFPWQIDVVDQGCTRWPACRGEMVS